ncbi:hypothetical protein [Halomonas sp. YLGW01]|uniref:hypothetical protein n=1 Tax=Halomonas sp. YLGW01 TaxID=2773308 RepID=UPI001782E8CD|nr:hypothetical protein [Halomonas sp. YLGW01]
MLSILVYFLIYAGVSMAVYQLYDIYHHQNFGDEERRSRAGKDAIEDLAHQARAYEATGDATDFLRGVKAFFGDAFDPRVALAAFSRSSDSLSDNSRTDTAKDQALPNVEPLLRRKHRIHCNAGIRIRHPLGVTTAPPTRDIRGALLSLIIINCLLALFLGGLSVYSIGYDVPAVWMQDESILMLAIYGLILITHLIAKLDLYLHDLHQIGRLTPHLPAASLAPAAGASEQPA